MHIHRQHPIDRLSSSNYDSAVENWFHGMSFSGILRVSLKWTQMNYKFQTFQDLQLSSKINSKHHIYFCIYSVLYIIKFVSFFTIPHRIGDRLFLCVLHAEIMISFHIYKSNTSCHQACKQQHFDTLRPRQNGCHFSDDLFKCIFLNENDLIPIQISLKFVPLSPIDNIPALVRIMAWRRPGNKSLSEPVMVRLPTHLYITRPQWVNTDSR